MGIPKIDGPMKNWTYIITGFTQHCGTRTRLIDLWAKLHAESDPRTDAVLLRSWKSDWDSEAEFVFRLNGQDPSIRICGYSWGAGWGAIQLCRALQRRGLAVERLALIDPVHRHPSPLRRWRTLFPSLVPIASPGNVASPVLWFGQRENWPRSHQITETRFVDGGMIRVACRHEHMDDNITVMLRCHEFLTRKAIQ